MQEGVILHQPWSDKKISGHLLSSGKFSIPLFLLHPFVIDLSVTQRHSLPWGIVSKCPRFVFEDSRVIRCISYRKCYVLPAALLALYRVTGRSACAVICQVTLGALVVSARRPEWNWRTCCRLPQQIVLVLSTRAAFFGRTDHPQGLKYTMLKTQNKIHMYFEFVRSYQLYQSVVIFRIFSF